MTMTMPKNKTCPIKVFFWWMFEIVGSCGHELLLPELLQLLNRPDLEGFSAGVKISDECSIKGSRINRLGVFFLNTHITNIYRYHSHIHQNIKVDACFGELCFSFFFVSCGADGNQWISTLALRQSYCYKQLLLCHRHHPLLRWRPWLLWMVRVGMTMVRPRRTVVTGPMETKVWAVVGVPSRVVPSNVVAPGMRSSDGKPRMKGPATQRICMVAWTVLGRSIMVRCRNITINFYMEIFLHLLHVPWRNFDLLFHVGSGSCMMYRPSRLVVCRCPRWCMRGRHPLWPVV